METDYSKVMNLALQLQEVGADRSRRLELEEQYHVATHELVDALLAAHGSADATTRVVDQDFIEMSNASDDELAPVYDRVRYDIFRRIDDVAGPTKAQDAARTRLIGIGATLFVILFAIGYAGVRQYSATPVTAPIESKEGIRQRADALAKVLRHDSFASSGRGIIGIIKNVLLWPIEPTETETQNAVEFAGAVLGVARGLQDEKAVCKLQLSTNNSIGEGEISLLEDVVSKVRDPATSWRNPPAMTIVDSIRAKFPC